MRYPDVIMHFEAVMITVFALVKHEGPPYPFASPRKKKEPELSIVRVNPRTILVEGKPNYYVKDGRCTDLTGMFFDPESGTGYGNFEKRDTLIFEWDRPAGKLTILVLKGASKGGAEDKLWHDTYLKGGVKRTTLFNRVNLNTASVTVTPPPGVAS